MKTKVIVCTEYSEQARAELLTRFGDRFDITFDEHAAALGDAEICIGEPPLALVQQAEKLRWVQMTWAGTDIYTRRTGFPERVTLTNASGAFGRTISEYVLGGILTMYRNFPAYREQQKQAVWRTVGAERTLYGRTVLILGTGDLGSNVAKRLRGFGTVNIGVRRRRCRILTRCAASRSSTSCCRRRTSSSAVCRIRRAPQDCLPRRACAA